MASDREFVRQFLDGLGIGYTEEADVREPENTLRVEEGDAKVESSHGGRFIDFDFDQDGNLTRLVIGGN